MCHPNEGTPHYHLRIKYPSGATRTIHELFERSGQGKDSYVTAGTIRDVYEFAHDLLCDEDKSKPFTLSWNGKKMDNRETKIRDFEVEGKRIQLYDGISPPILLVFDSEN